MGRVVADGAPRFTHDDTVLAVALQHLDAAACSGCGQDRRQSTNPDNEYKWRADAVRCHACAARDRKAAAHEAAGGSTAGLLFSVHLPNDEGAP